ncbi:HutD family protein [Paenibacillus sp. SYP-B3998]|uniref:HutD family protein n=1 Tax=Paenibacillus sp. SYP-B3998 TaxID=2678564 RepID=A0A6G4A441_9BACL|nr:HutD family protein [Paenibacillus sp. SYP-B3998]NEW08579.1 HutD family protein [Paenibacillus sp. SYP-B3998]
MSHSIKIIKKHEQITSAWSGGTTTELAIYPEHAEYNKRNFLWRISTASIQDEQSLFTCLPEFWRKLMVIEGEVILEYEGSHQVGLKPYEQESFSGGWVTRSMGKVTDFNLITAAGCQGEVEAFQIRRGEFHELEDNVDNIEFMRVTEAFYCIRGRIGLKVNDGESQCLEEGDFILLPQRTTCQNVNIKIYNNHDKITAHVIRVIIMN